MTASFSLVIPLFGVERYLPAFLDSLATQSRGDFTTELIFVDDGSPDRSAAIVQRWIDARPPVSGVTATLVRQSNHGVSAARNRGLDVATGDWISFPDPDDVIDQRYLATVASFLGRIADPAPAAVATYIVRLDDRARGAIVDNHALRRRFSAGSRVVDIDEKPDVFLLNVATAFFPRQEVVSSGVRFREALHASEDALFVAEYLLSRTSRRLGLVKEARYLYRRRASADSAVDRYRSEPDSYTVRFEEGYLPLCVNAAARIGHVPAWLQSTLLYEYKWLFEPQMTPTGYAAALDEAQRAEVLDITRRLLAHITDDRILRFSAASLSLEVRFLLLALKGSALPDWQPPFTDRVDASRGVKRVRYFTVGEDGDSADGTISKRRDPDYFGQTALHEVISWVTETATRLTVGSKSVPILVVPSTESLESARDAARRQSAGAAAATPAARRLWSRMRRGAASKVTVIRGVSALPLVRSRYRGVWLVEAPADEHVRKLVVTARRAGERIVIVGEEPLLGELPRIRRGSLHHLIAMLTARGVISARPDVASAIRPSLYRGRRKIRLTWIGDRLPENADLVALDRADVDRLVVVSDDHEGDAVVAALSTSPYGEHEIAIVADEPDSLWRAASGHR